MADQDENPQANSLLTVTQLIQNYLAQIDRDKKELTSHREMLEDAFMNDATYKEQADKVKEAAKIRNATKKQIMNRPELKELSEKVREVRDSIKEAQMQLSEYLQEFTRISGSRTLEGPNGEIQEIIYVAKLIKPNKKKYGK